MLITNVITFNINFVNVFSLQENSTYVRLKQKSNKTYRNEVKMQFAYYKTNSVNKSYKNHE